MAGRVENKVAIVTGSGSTPGGSAAGIGQAIATVLVREGASVLVVDRDPERAEATVSGFDGLAGRGVVFEADVTSPSDCEAMVAAAVDQFGGLDILVNNAAISRHFPLTATPLEEYDQTLDINLKGSFLASAAAVPALIERGGGSIVMIGSIAGIRDSGTSHPAYSASKAGQLGLMLDIAGEYGRRNIRANAVLPGIIASPMLESVSGGGLSDDRRARLNMLGRMGSVWDVAHAVLFLCTDEGSYMTGHVMPVDGGATMSMSGSYTRGRPGPRVGRPVSALPRPCRSGRPEHPDAGRAARAGDRGRPGAGPPGVPVSSFGFATFVDRKPDTGLHPAPQRQFVVVIRGELEVETPDGSVRRLRAGDVMFADDVDTSATTAATSARSRWG